MVSLNNVKKELYNIKEYVIGVYHHNNITYLILSHNEENKTLDVINFTQFGAIQKTSSIPILGHYELFPDNQNMNQMLNNSFEWTKFISKFSGMI